MSFGRGIRFAKAFIELSIDATNTKKQMRSFRNQLRQFGRVARPIFAAMGAGAAAFGASMAIATGIMAKAVVAASKLNEVTSRFGIVLGKNREAAKAFTESLVAGLGQSRRSMQSTMSSFVGQLKAARLDPNAAFELSKSLTKASVDLASFFDRDQAETFERMQAAIDGSGKTMRVFNITLNEATVSAELLKRGLNPTTASNYQKVLARVAIIMNGVSDAQGDAARTGASVTNQWRKVQNQMKNLLEESGQELLPDIADVLGEINSLMPEIVSAFKAMAVASRATLQASATIAANFRSIRNPTGAVGFVASLPAQALAGAARGLTSTRITDDSIPDVAVDDSGAEKAKTDLDEAFGGNVETPKEAKARRQSEFDRRLRGARLRGFQNMITSRAKGLPAALGFQIAQVSKKAAGLLPAGAIAAAGGLTGNAPNTSQFSTGAFAKDFTGANMTSQSVSIEKQQLNVITDMFNWMRENGVVFQ